MNENNKNSNISQIVLVALLVVASFFIGTLLNRVKNLETGTDTNTQTTADTTQQATPTVGIDQVRKAFDDAYIKFGTSGDKLVLLEISDPSCPYCSIAGGKNSELNSQSSQFKLVEDGGTYVAPVPEFKNLQNEGKASYALIYTPGHGNGEMGMKALYCAFDMGKFWEVEELIMSSTGYDLLNDTVANDPSKSDVLAKFLVSVVNEADMKACLDSGKFDDQLDIDMNIASSLGVNGTPAFFVNDDLFSGAYSFDDMKPTVEAVIGNE